MTPRAAQDAVRDALIEHAARLLREGGAGALSARKLAALVGTSTTAVYTYFGSMEDLRRAVRIEAFQRVADSLGRVPLTDDPICDAAALGAAYLGNAIASPALYRAMFLEEVFSDAEREIGMATFSRLATAMTRCVETGVINRDDADGVALEFWAATHGVASLYVAEMWSADEALLRMAGVGRTLLLGLGVPEEDVDRALTYSAKYVSPPRHGSGSTSRRRPA